MIETFNGFTSTLVVDPVTGHERFDPMPPAAMLAGFYRTFEAGGLRREDVRTFALTLIEKMRSLGFESFHAHDVGCGDGLLVSVLNELGVTATGNDYSPSLEEVLAPLPYKIELFTAYHVLEHLTDPLACLHTIAQRLHPRGLVDIKLPNAHCLLALVGGRRADPCYEFPMHLQYFTPKSLVAMLRAADLEPVVVETIPLFESGRTSNVPAGWETALGIPSEAVVNADAWAAGAAANLLGGELHITAAHRGNHYIAREPDIDQRVEKAITAFTHGARRFERERPRQWTASLRRLAAALR